MPISQDKFSPSSNQHLLLVYIADLELEVDRLRKQGQLLHQEAGETVQRIQQICRETTRPAGDSPQIDAVAQAARQFAELLRDTYEPAGYHPAHDQVVAIAVRPLIEQVFRWQQRLSGAQHAVLHLELATEHVEWFPARFRHILDNLISNALKYRDPAKGEARVFLGLTRMTESYELRISDNGLGMPWDKRAEAFELFYRAAPVRAAGLGVGLAVVKLLVEQSGGSLTVDSGAGQGTSFVVVLPRYDVADYLS